MDFEKDIAPVEEILLSEEYGFEKFEIRHIVHYKPTVFLIEDDYKINKGIKALKELLMEEKGFDLKTVRHFVIRYP